ncbi:UPF0481 protein [Prunus yedoensis var. nudiflora]|uniref:UPF0481 protein n=1 Tax=Prunus yedoensis var. nudiflora TaxID=2094558 RepID=A0A314Z4E7_PRUYE|nr:UPF0481 protein [Prunus yedoensis var. nudiflora]
MRHNVFSRAASGRTASQEYCSTLRRTKSTSQITEKHREWRRVPENHKNDYILSSPWLRKAVEQDLILIENQLPYFLLQELYQNFAVPCCWWIPSNDHSIEIDKATPADHEPTLLELTFKFFEDYSEGKGKSDKHGVPQLKHLTDLVRHFLCPEPTKEMPLHCEHGVENIYAAKKLRAPGVKFRAT